ILDCPRSGLRRRLLSLSGRSRKLAAAFFRLLNQELLMQSFRAVLLAAAMLVAPFGAPAAMAADSLDLSAIKCQEFLGSGKDNIAMIITWLDGYYKDQDDPPILDFTKFAADSEK